MLDDGTAVASWVEFANQQGQFKARRISASAPASTPVAVQGTAGGRVGGFPRMTRQGGELLFVWNESAGGEHAEHGGGPDQAVQTKGAVARLR